MTGKEDGCGCKVESVRTDYGLQYRDDQLVQKWQSGVSVRKLTENLNKDIIEAALSAANVTQHQWSRSPVYEALTTDELSEAEEIEIRRELDRAGVDVEQLSSDLVSHQTVYRHLKQCLGATKDDSQTPDERRQKAKDTVFALQQRLETVTESTLETLQSAGIADLGETDVLVDLNVVCSDCGRSMGFETAVRDGCSCNNT
ncbi:rod-determining factor RdfA [Halorussus salinisoli]|uniref:rod-determining factor RdfA n=1 Tax=Halorussus salinisoli TaxID=2558242 RepID=UPI0010C1DB14|nr:rod-determining factor RdfA [Halorussus salinisoli]